MKKSRPFFRLQFSLFKQEKGMLIFYLICMLLIGVALPLFSLGMETILIITAMFTVMFLKPMLSDMMAGERERKTLESLLSTPADGKYILRGKIRFSIVFAVIFYAITLLCAVFISFLCGRIPDMALWQWLCALPVAMLDFIAVSVSGIYISAVAEDSRTASSRISRIVYPLGLLEIIQVTTLFIVPMLPSLVISIGAALLYAIVILFYCTKRERQKQSVYFENFREHHKEKAHGHHQMTRTKPKSQFSIVLIHELKYLWKLKMLLLNFVILCVCPAIVVYIFKYYTGVVNLYYPVLLTVLMLPRAPVNLIAYSIGGEKSYKTGECLISTPLRLRPMFLAKSTVPIIISTLMLVVSSLLTLGVANIIGTYFEAGAHYSYTADQWILLFPVSIMSGIAMVFITGILSVNLKTPRQGLYASTLIGVAFLIPPLLIVYLAPDKLLWSMIYFVLLLLGNALCVRGISDKITRPQIMAKL